MYPFVVTYVPQCYSLTVPQVIWTPHSSPQVSYIHQYHESSTCVIVHSRPNTSSSIDKIHTQVRAAHQRALTHSFVHGTRVIYHAQYPSHNSTPQYHNITFTVWYQSVTTTISHHIISAAVTRITSSTTKF